MPTMRRRPILVALAAALAGLAAVPSLRASEAPPASGRVVLLGFDGASHDLAQRFMAEGRMPNCARLAEQGAFAPLGSANPAESPVAWASINTGMNPGKTNIFGFMRRLHDPLLPFPRPTIGYSRDVNLPLATTSGSRTSASPESSAAGAPEDGMAAGGNVKWASILGAAGLIVGYGLLRGVFKLKGGAAGFVALLLGAGAAVLGWNMDARAAEPGPAAPAAWSEGGLTMPSHANDLKVQNFWDYLDAAGIGSRILQAACNYPAEAGSHARLLSGLSTPDVGGGPGTYYIYTNSDFEFDRDMPNGGKLVKFRVKEGGFESRLYGPKQFVLEQEKRQELDALKAKLKATTDAQEKSVLDREVRGKAFQLEEWRKKEGKATLALTGTVDPQNRTIRFELPGHDVTVKEGEWSEYLPITFEVEGAFPVHATVRFHVSQCNPDQEEVRFFLPAITVAPDHQPPNMHITSPLDFGKELVQDAGYFDTIGWSCQTHAYKDEQISVQSFLSEIWETIQWRRRMLLAQLEEPDWKVLFQVFGTPDRVCHMMYNFFDEQHPTYDAAAAQTKVRFGDREITYKDAVAAIYEEMDETVGIVLDKIDRGELGEDATLLVVSDHGFSPFREEVELNAWLIEQGFLAVKQANGQPSTSSKMLSGDSYVDWSKTRAYSMGLGTIYLNLKGREDYGVVEPADYDKVCDEIIDAMRKYRNPSADSVNDPRVFADAWKRSDFLAGPYAEDQKDADGKHTEGPADIQVGFNYGYRVAWGSALGDREVSRGVVFPNKSRWSGDHTTVHPYLVRGVFLSNRKLATPTEPHLQDAAPTILALQGVAVPADMDGHVIPLVGLEEAAQKHQGNDFNRQSLVPPPQ